MRPIVCAILVCLSAISASCFGLSKNHDYFSGMKSFSFDTIDRVKIDSLEVVDIDIDEIGLIRAMIMLDDGRLALLDRDNKAQVKLLDLKSGAILRTVPVGEGPDEILNINTMVLKDNNLWVGGTFDKKIGRIDTSNDPLELETIGTTDEMFLYIAPIDSTKLLTAPLSIERDRFHLTDFKSKKTTVTGNFPFFDANANNAVFQGEASLSTDGSVIIIVNKSWGIIELLDAPRLTTRSLTYGPDKVESAIDIVESAQGTRFRQSPLHLVLAGISPADDTFFVGYIGGCSKNWETMSKGISGIIQYNYDGDAIRYYTLPEEIVRFAVDRTGKNLYGIKENTNDGKMMLVKCSLS